MTMTSRHYTQDRQAREAVIQSIGYGKPVATMEVDKGHRNGPEVHTLSTTGIITIRNKRTRKVITNLIARPGQVRRFFQGQAPGYLLDLAMEHQRLGYNMA